MSDQLDAIAAIVAPLCLEPAYVVRVDAAFVPLRVTVSRGRYVPGELRSRQSESPVPLPPVLRGILERAMARYYEETRDATGHYLHVTLTVFANGTYGFGGTREDLPR